MTALLAIDQGTTSSKALVFDDSRTVLGRGQHPFDQHYPQNGWVEHDPEDIWQTTLAACRDAINDADITSANIAAIGITNQRETTIIWNRETGAPIHRAIVWQDRRTAELCQHLTDDGHDDLFRSRTGLLLDAYFSGTKIAWILDHVTGARAQAEAGKLAFGTIDTFLLWRLTGGAVHATDATNASRTLLFDIHRQCWDEELCQLLNIPLSLLPDVYDSVADFGTTEPSLLGAAIPITGVVGDQQAALIGQGCLDAGAAKCTYGTGAFLMAHTGDHVVTSQARLLATVAYRLGGTPSYALEGSVFNVGTIMGWLGDTLGLFEDPAQTADMARAANPNSQVQLVPAFTGLGAPYWDADARGILTGLTRDSGPNELVRAALESIVLQTQDLLGAIARDGVTLDALKIDGGVSRNDWLTQYLADVSGVPVHRSANPEATALGAALLAGVGANIWPDLHSAAHSEAPGTSPGTSPTTTYLPEWNTGQRNDRYTRWQDAVWRARTAD